MVEFKNEINNKSYNLIVKKTTTHTSHFTLAIFSSLSCLSQYFYLSPGKFCPITLKTTTSTPFKLPIPAMDGSLTNCCRAGAWACPLLLRREEHDREGCIHPWGSAQEIERLHRVVVQGKSSPNSPTWDSTFRHCRTSREWRPRIWERLVLCAYSLRPVNCSSFSSQDSRFPAQLCQLWWTSQNIKIFSN